MLSARYWRDGWLSEPTGSVTVVDAPTT